MGQGKSVLNAISKRWLLEGISHPTKKSRSRFYIPIPIPGIFGIFSGFFEVFISRSRSPGFFRDFSLGIFSGFPNPDSDSRDSGISGFSGFFDLAQNKKSRSRIPGIEIRDPEKSNPETNSAINSGIKSVFVLTLILTFLPGLVTQSFEALLSRVQNNFQKQPIYQNIVENVKFEPFAIPLRSSPGDLERNFEIFVTPRPNKCSIRREH